MLEDGRITTAQLLTAVFEAIFLTANASTRIPSNLSASVLPIGLTCGE